MKLVRSTVGTKNTSNVQSNLKFTYYKQCYGNQSNVVKTSHKKGFGSEHQNTNQFDFFQGLTKPLFTKCKPHIERTSATIIKITIIASGVINSMIAQQLDMSSVLSFSLAKCIVGCLQSFPPPFRLNWFLDCFLITWQIHRL